MLCGTWKEDIFLRVPSEMLREYASGRAMFVRGLDSERVAIKEFWSLFLYNVPDAQILVF